MLHARRHTQACEDRRFFYQSFMVLEKQNYTRIEGRRIEEEQIIATTLTCSSYTSALTAKHGLLTFPVHFCDADENRLAENISF